MLKAISIFFVLSIPLMFTAQNENQYDESGKKTGYWRILASNGSPKGYKTGSLYQEGNYKRSRKDGTWKTYWSNGKLKSKVVYRYGRTFGAFEAYYSTGVLQEKGSLKNGKYAGTHEYYFPSGCIQSRQVFDEEGIPVSNDFFEDCDNTPVSKPVVKPIEKPAEKPAPPKKNDPNKPFADVKDGYHKLYNDDKELHMEGEFKNGALYNGNWYRYDDLGLFLHIDVYRNGRYYTKSLK